ncbi:MAG: glutamate racemase [Armatimonadetes bacterium]|nr:glutamate racemase [Armatimonadota bacterium]
MNSGFTSGLNGRKGANGHAFGSEESLTLLQRPLPVPVGVFDSGLGGLTVAREIMRQMPGTPMIYLADTAHVPYGPRPACEIQAFAHGIIRALLDAGAGAVVAACNMSSALALPTLLDDYPVPILGMIHPGVDAAFRVMDSGPLGVIATEGTCKSYAYPSRAQALRPDLEVLQSPCPDFVPLVEAGRTESAEAYAASERYLRPLLGAGCKTIILGCTHYPWLLPVLKDVAGPEVWFVDPAQAAVEALQNALYAPEGGAETPWSPPAHRFAATADPERLEEGVCQWLGINARAEYWPLWEETALVPSAPVAGTVLR